MNKLIPAFVLVLSMTLLSCVRSLYPLTENENEMIFKKELLGHWKDNDSTHYIVDTLTGKNGKVYTLTLIESKKNREPSRFSDTSYFLASLVNIKGKLFMDCIADMKKFENKGLGETAVNSVMALHYVVGLAAIGPDSIQVTLIDEDKLSSLLKQKKLNIRQEQPDEDDILLTERPTALQKKLIEMQKIPSLFSDETLLRVKNEN